MEKMVNRHQISRVLLVAGLLAILTPGILFSAESREPIPALTRYPWLEDYFAYGFWFADAPHARDLAAELGEPWEVRQEKTFYDLSRHNVNAVIPANQAVGPPYLERVRKYGLRAATMPLFLYHHTDNRGNLKGEDLERVKAMWSDHAGHLKDHPALLAYHVFDEPHPTISPKIQGITDALARVDPAHPAIYTHQNLPLNRDNADWGRVEWALLDSLDVHLSDLYSIEPAFGRDPWLYGDVAMVNYRLVDPDAIHWPIIQAFAFHATPTVPEVRVMVFHTIACGAKGVFFFTTEQAYVSWIRHFYPSVGNPWFAEEPMYADISRIGRHLASAGPLLMPRRLDPDYPVRVKTPTFRAIVRSGWLREDGNLARPAIHVGAFVGKDFDVLVIHNDDPWAEHAGRITVTGRGTRVYDLEALEAVRTRVRGTRVEFNVEFVPGNGRLYLVGDEADFEAAKSTIKRHWYERDSLLVDLEVNIAGSCGVGVKPVREKLQQAGDAAGGGDYTTALELVTAARARLVEVEAAHPEYSRTVAALDRMREELHRIDEWCEIHEDFVSGELGDARLSGLIGRGREYARQFVTLENALRAGGLQGDEAVKLQAEITSLAHSIVTHRPELLRQRRIALLELGEHTGDAFFLHDWLAMIYQHVDVLKSDGKGGFVDAEGRSIRLGSYDLLWIHLGDPGGPVKATYCVEARVARDALPRASVTVIDKYVNSGGGLILSGLGAALVDDLGYDSTEPDEKYWGPLKVPGGSKMQWVSFNDCGKVLGLKPKVPRHPIFEGLEAGGFAIWDWALSELVAKAVWRKPVWPRNGKVLAGYHSDGADIPDEFAVVVEFTRPGAGKVIAVGDGLDPTRDGAYGGGSRWGTNQDRFIRNLVKYCSR